MNDIADALDKLAKTLAPYDRRSANYVRKQKGIPAQQIADDLNLWGGMGSLMDEGVAGKGREIQRPFEAAAVELAAKLKAAGAINARVEKWVDVFTHWQKNGT